MTATVTAAVKAVALGSGGADDKPRGVCRFWGTSGGCSRGEACTYLHSWDGINKENRCYGCSGEGHMKKDCPHKKDSGSKQKVAKIKYKSRDLPEKGSDAVGSVVKPEDAAPTPTPGKPSIVEGSIPNGSGGQPGHAIGGSTSAESATTLLNEATVLLKSLKSLKAMKLKQINVDATTSWRPMALLDGGATHGLRMAYASEINQLEQVEVELASGTAFLYRHPAHKTLFSKTPIDPIVPLHRLVQMGCRTGLPVAARSTTQ